jgi:hypothetical protein
MRHLSLAALTAALVLALPAASLAGAGNPSGTGPPSQNCENVINTVPGGHAPGKSEEATGSPFNPEGIAGGKYNAERSQYDVACYHVSH